MINRIDKALNSLKKAIFGAPEMDMDCGCNSEPKPEIEMEPMIGEQEGQKEETVDTPVVDAELEDELYRVTATTIEELANSAAFKKDLRKYFKYDGRVYKPKIKVTPPPGVMHPSKWHRVRIYFSVSFRHPSPFSFSNQHASNLQVAFFSALVIIETSTKS